MYAHARARSSGRKWQTEQGQLILLLGVITLSTAYIQQKATAPCVAITITTLRKAAAATATVALTTGRSTGACRRGQTWQSADYRYLHTRIYIMPVVANRRNISRYSNDEFGDFPVLIIERKVTSRADRRMHSIRF